jgi:hypothetical protein
MSAESMAELVGLVMIYRQYHGILQTSAASVEAEIEDQICQRLGPEFCHVNAGEFYSNGGFSLTTAKIAEVSEIVFDFIRAGAEFVPVEESKRRADICAKCPFNRTPPTCLCTPMWKAMDALVPADRRDNRMRVCQVCGCTVQVKTLISSKILSKADAGRQITYPSWCWMTENNNGQT